MPFYRKLRGAVVENGYALCGPQNWRGHSVEHGRESNTMNGCKYPEIAKGVACDHHDECETCGWSPEVAEARQQKIALELHEIGMASPYTLRTKRGDGHESE